MKYIAIILIAIIFTACSTKQPKELYQSNNVHLPYKIKSLKFDDSKRGNPVVSEISLSLMPSEDNFKTISPFLNPDLQKSSELIIRNAFKGTNDEYDVVLRIEKATKTLTKTWKESSEEVEIELVLEMVRVSDGSSLLATSKLSNKFEAVNVSDKHAQKMFEITFKNAVYKALEEVQKKMKK